MRNKKYTKRKKLVYVSDLWLDTTNDSVSLGLRVENLEEQMFELKRIVEYKIKKSGGFNA